MLKEKVYLNRINVDYKTIYARVKDYFSRHGVEIDFDFVQSDYKGLGYRNAMFSFGERTLLNPSMASVVPIDMSYDLTSFVFNGREFKAPNIPTGLCYMPSRQPFLEILTDELNPKDLDYVLVCHEHMHALVQLANLAGYQVHDVMDTYYRNQFLEDKDSNFGRQWNLLSGFIKSLKPMYKYFKDSEIVGLKPQLVAMLDKARDIAGVPFKITSGHRSSSQNALVGVVEGSSHETGLAVDLAVADSVSGGKILLALVQAGFKRFGFYNDGHIHCDIDSSKPNPCYWIK